MKQRPFEAKQINLYGHTERDKDENNKKNNIEWRRFKN